MYVRRVAAENMADIPQPIYVMKVRTLVFTESICEAVLGKSYTEKETKYINC